MERREFLSTLIAAVPAACFLSHGFVVPVWRDIPTEIRPQITVEQINELVRITLPNYRRGGWIDLPGATAKMDSEGSIIAMEWEDGHSIQVIG